MIGRCWGVWQKVVEVLGGRIQAGSALAGIPVAFTIAGIIDSWNCVVTSLFGVGTGVVLALTLAPWAPLLNKLSAPVGAPKVRITFTELVNENENRWAYSQSLLLEVAVNPSTRLDDAVVNFQFPRDLFEEVSRVVHLQGEQASGRGAFLPIPGTSHPTETSPISWWSSYEDIRAGSQLYVFMLDMRDLGPQTFKVGMLVTSEKLYGNSAFAEYEVAWRT